MEAVYTVGEECKKCYSCVRTCPTKAIEVHGGSIHAGNNPDGGAFFEIKIKKTFEEDSIVKDINSR